MNNGINTETRGTCEPESSLEPTDPPLEMNNAEMMKLLASLLAMQSKVPEKGPESLSALLKVGCDLCYSHVFNP